MSGTKGSVSVSLDWLAFTVKDTVAYDWGAVGFYESDVTPIRGYNVGRRHASGARVYHNMQRDDMGAHVVLDGTALGNLAVACDSSFELLDWYLTGDAKPSRVDIAVDMVGTGLSVDRLKRAHDERHAVTRARRIAYTTEKRDHKLSGAGLYVGSTKNRSKLVCIYDKGLESGEFDLSQWLRAELRVYGEYAQNACSSIKSSPDREGLAMGMLRSVVDYPSIGEWSSAVDAPLSKIPPRTTKDTKPQKWLINTVAPVIARELIEGGAAFGERLEDAIQAAYDALLSQGSG